MPAYEEDLFDGMAYDEAEGSAALFDDDGFDDMDAMGDGDPALDGFDGFDGADAFDPDGFDAFGDGEGDGFDDLEGDGFEAMADFDDFGADGYEAFEAEEAEDLLDSAMAYALEAEDADEFFRKLWGGLKKVGRGIGRVARKAAPVIGRVARVAAPILGSIPTPWTQGLGVAARLLGTLRAEGASEEEALDAFAELAVKQPAAVPIVAGLTARAVLKGAGKRLSAGARKRAVKDAKAAAKLLMRKRGPAAVRAMPKIAAAVRRQAAAKRTPAVARTQVVKRAAVKVARSPEMARKLSQPSTKARRLVQGTGGGKVRTIAIPYPARITITPL